MEFALLRNSSPYEFRTMFLPTRSKRGTPSSISSLRMFDPRAGWGDVQHIGSLGHMLKACRKLEIPKLLYIHDCFSPRMQNSASLIQHKLTAPLNKRTDRAPVKRPAAHVPSNKNRFLFHDCLQRNRHAYSVAYNLWPGARDSNLKTTARSSSEATK